MLLFFLMSIVAMAAEVFTVIPAEPGTFRLAAYNGALTIKRPVVGWQVGYDTANVNSGQVSYRMWPLDAGASTYTLDRPVLFPDGKVRIYDVSNSATTNGRCIATYESLDAWLATTVIED